MKLFSVVGFMAFLLHISVHAHQPLDVPPAQKSDLPGTDRTGGDQEDDDNQPAEPAS